MAETSGGLPGPVIRTQHDARLAHTRCTLQPRLLKVPSHMPGHMMRPFPLLNYTSSR